MQLTPICMWFGPTFFHTTQEMRKTEVDHLDKMNELLVDRRVRPTALLPLWDAAGFALGGGCRLCIWWDGTDLPLPSDTGPGPGDPPGQGGAAAPAAPSVAP